MTEIKPISTADELFDGKTRLLARYSDSTGWSAFNPSITFTQEHGFIVLIRSANGYLEDHRPEFQTAIGRELESNDSYMEPNEWQVSAKLTALYKGEQYYRNRMFIAKLDAKKLILGSQHEVDLSATEAAAPVEIKRGIEDGRIYSDGESLRISATAFETHYIPFARICNFELHVPSVDRAYTTGFEMFDSPQGEAIVEKNWMPVDKGLMPKSKRPKFDYVYDAGSTFTIKDKSLNKVGGFELPLRGGSQLIPLEDGTFLAIMHQVVTQEYMRFADIKKSPLMKRRYVHRFVQFSADGQIIKVTDPFNFINKSIEFASGLVQYEDRLLVTFGALDSSAHISSVSLELVLASLRRPRLSV
jgi:hypothetical protein